MEDRWLSKQGSKKHTGIIGIESFANKRCSIGGCRKMVMQLFGLRHGPCFHSFSVLLQDVTMYAHMTRNAKSKKLLKNVYTEKF